MQTEISDVARAAEHLLAVRRERAAYRRRTRSLIDAMEREAKRHLAAVFSDDDPITGRPVCLLITSEDRLGDDYERESPRAIPDSHNRLTVEVLGRILTVDLDDFGRAHVEGVTSAAGLQAAAMAGDDVVFHGEDTAAPPVPFATLLAQLLDHVWLDERAALPVPADSPAA